MPPRVFDRPKPSRRPAIALDPRFFYVGRIVIQASYKLTLATKDVWQEVTTLDRPKDGIGGCFMAEDEMASGLGLSVDTISDARRYLVGVGLMCKVDVPGARGAWWFPVLPRVVEVLTREPFSAMAPKRRRAWIRMQADELDRSLDDRSNGNDSMPVSRKPVPPPARGSLEKISDILSRLSVVRAHNDEPPPPDESPPDEPNEDEDPWAFEAEDFA